MMRCGRLIAFLVIAGVAVGFDGQAAWAAECKVKTAGFFLQFPQFASPIRRSVATQSLPASLTGVAGNPAGGKDVFVSQQRGACLSCHKVTALQSNSEQGAIGPSLDGVGERYNEGQLRLWIVNAKAYAPRTMMPSYFSKSDAPGSSVLAATEVEDLVAYMKTLK